MKKVNLSIQVGIATDYLQGMKYKDIMKRFGVNRWNIQAALSKFDIKTNRIKSTPRLPGGYKKMTNAIIERYHDMDYLPLIKVNKNNPVLESDLDIMEHYNETEDTQSEKEKYVEIDILENDEIRYIERE